MRSSHFSLATVLKPSSESTYQSHSDSHRGGAASPGLRPRRLRLHHRPRELARVLAAPGADHQCRSLAPAGDRARLVLRMLGREVELEMQLTRIEPYRVVEYTSKQRGLPAARHWRHFDQAGDVLAYRIVVEYQPRPGLPNIFDRFVLLRCPPPSSRSRRATSSWSLGMIGTEPAGTGTVMRTETVRRYASEALFGNVEVLRSTRLLPLLQADGLGIDRADGWLSLPPRRARRLGARGRARPRSARAHARRRP